MTRLAFDPNASLLVFPCLVEYRRRILLDLALDTGASTTIISIKAAREIGYDLSQISDLVSFADASKTHLVPGVTLKSLSFADARIEDIEALCYTIPEEHGIDGVMGLNFLRHFNISLDFERGMLTLNHFG